ncbi:MAG: hypothetical protein U1E39_14465 [Planctomycetota bacterium]
MRIRSAFVVVLSLAALAAAVQFFVSTPPAALDVSSTDDGRAQPETLSPAPILAAAPRRERDHGVPLVGSAPLADTKVFSDAAVRDALRDSWSKEMSQIAISDLDAPIYLPELRADFVDPVTERIDAAAAVLRSLDDDQAIPLARLSDDEYRAAQAASSRELEVAGVLPRRPPLPDRYPAGIDNWLLEPVDVQGFVASGAPTSDDEPWPREHMEGSAALRSVIQRQRRVSARGYYFEVARLQLQLLRELDGHRENRRRVETVADLLELCAEYSSWMKRYDSWIRADQDSPEDARELHELAISIPSRRWFPLTTEERGKLLEGLRDDDLEFAAE